jgi:distribution and morphology protein 12
VEKVPDDPSNVRRLASPPAFSLQQAQPSDLQVVARVQYSGDVRVMLTAEILLDYPMPSFVGIPLKLSITGISFDGVAIVAYIRKRMHFCFLDPDDAQTLVGEQIRQEENPSRGQEKTDLALNGLIKEIHIESEIGRQDSGKQVLKNVGKVEKFVLEQIRRIFEEEFVFPSFWTILV